MRLGIDPKVDVVFKRLFGSEKTARLLVSLLNAILAGLSPAWPVTGVAFVLPGGEKESPRDKEAIADVKARDDGNRQFHLEMQWQVPAAFLKRMLFYWSKFHPRQLREGENYLTLRPTVSICFLDRILFPQTEEYHLVFEVRERKHELLLCDDLQMHLFELPKFTKSAEELTSALDRWLYLLRHGADLDPDALPSTLDVPEIRQALEVMAVFTQEERDRELYELREKIEMDKVAFPIAFRQEFLEEGRKEGIKEGQ
jgi:predicted transposase/invertase (TIGR01784 family)